MALVLLLLSCCWSIAQENSNSLLPTNKATAAEEINLIFNNTKGWIGADGNYSVKISADKALWFFSDTWLGEVKNNKRINPALINNSIGVQVFKGDQSAVQYYWGKPAEGKPAAFFIPKDNKGWFWPVAGKMQGKKLMLFLWQSEKTKTPGAFGFKTIGTTLIEIDNPEANPLDWKLKQLSLPYSKFNDKKNIVFGSALCEDKNFDYIFGYEETPSGIYKKMLVARSPKNNLANFSAWKFYAGANWSSDLNLAKPILDGIASEYSVHYSNGHKKFVLVYHDAFLSPNIVARTSDNPWGPWSEKILLHTCVENSWHKDNFCYAGKAQPNLSDDKHLLISYASNTKTLAGVINDARLYWPKFIKVNLTP